MGKRVIIDGMPVDLPAGFTVGDLRKQKGIAVNEQLVHVKGSASKPLADSDEIEDNARLVSIPSITKG